MEISELAQEVVNEMLPREMLQRRVRGSLSKPITETKVATE